MWEFVQEISFLPAKSAEKMNGPLSLARDSCHKTGIVITETGVPGKGSRFGMIVPNGAYRFISTGQKIPGPENKYPPVNTGRALP